jgi:cytochrome c oxidase subunit 3
LRSWALRTDRQEGQVISDKTEYFLPLPARWPIVGSAALLLMASGGATWLNHGASGPYVLAVGAAVLAYTLLGWFGAVIGEGRLGLYDAQVEASFRWGMAWFLFSEVVVFATLFAALFYTRMISVPDLASGETHTLLWPAFKPGWPVSGPGIEGTFSAMNGWGIPTLNTIMLLVSGITIALAHRALNKGHRVQLAVFLLTTILLGVLFLRNQASEYQHAYTALNLTLATGAYGATFFVLTGLHGVHVAIGTAFLIIMLARILRGDFTAKHHVGFLAANWYWHFVGVIWLILFVVVYWL